MRGSLEKERGFTLVEIVVSILLLSTVVAGILVVFVVGRRSVNLAGHRVQTMDFARETIEDLKGKVGGILWSSPNTELREEPKPWEALGGELGKFGGKRTYTVTDIGGDGNPDTPDENYKKVTVTVNWEEP